MARIEPILSSRRDVGILKLAKFIADLYGAKLVPDWYRELFPIPLPRIEQTDEEMMAAMGSLLQKG